MYSLKSAYGVGIDPESIWSEEDVSQILVKRLFSVYRDLYLTLTNPFIEGDVFVRLNDLKDDKNDIDFEKIEKESALVFQKLNVNAKIYGDLSQHKLNFLLYT